MQTKRKMKDEHFEPFFYTTNKNFQCLKSLAMHEIRPSSLRHFGVHHSISVHKLYKLVYTINCTILFLYLISSKLIIFLYVAVSIYFIEIYIYCSFCYTALRVLYNIYYVILYNSNGYG